MGNTKHTKEQIRERIQRKKLLFDGAFGTYYGGKYDTKQLPELANLEAPERVKEIIHTYCNGSATPYFQQFCEEEEQKLYQTVVSALADQTVSY